MKTTIAAIAALGAIPLAATGVGPATGSPAHGAFSGVTASSACHSALAPQPVPEVANELAAVQFVSATTGWVAGANRVLATTDGGTKWSLQRSARGAHYSEVDAIDAHHAWVVGRHQLIRTTNGGATWHRLPEPCAVITSVHFVSPSRGFAVAGGRLLKTTDAGAKWKRMPAPAVVQSACFTNPRRGWLGAHGRIYRTVNGGATWALAVVGPTVHGTANEPFAAVECAGPDAGWAELIGPGAASNQSPHIGYYLNDSGSRPIFAEQYFSHPGVKIHRESPGSESASFSAVDASSAVFVDWCPACGAGTAPMAIARNAGKTLDRVGRVRNINQAFGISFASTTDGWAVGGRDHFSSHGNHVTWKIEHTTDGGRRWTTQYVE